MPQSRRRCALVTLDEDVQELEELAQSAGYEILYEIIQRRARPDPVTFLGKGKIAEVAEALVSRPVELMIVNGELRPSHHYQLENALRVECMDRVRLVLEIFSLRAGDKQSRLQVERARLRYEVPLLREWIHSAKKGEHPGFLGSGEYAVDVYYDLIKKRMRRIDEELRHARGSNRQRREQRRRMGFRLVSLAGYTNAGKSSLMKALTREEVLIEDRMFSTLSTTTKRVPPSSTILLTDTIGFIHDLPHFVIEAFKNTIEEIFSADLVLLVLDASEDWQEIDRKLRTSEDILLPELEPEQIMLVLNKIDKLGAEELEETKDIVETFLPSLDLTVVSAMTGEGVEALRSSILERFQFHKRFEALLPQTGGTERLLTGLRTKADIYDIEYSNEVRVRGACREADLKQLISDVKALKGRIAFEDSEEPDKARDGSP